MFLSGRVAREDYGLFAQLAINSLVTAWPVGESWATLATSVNVAPWFFPLRLGN